MNSYYFDLGQKSVLVHDLRFMKATFEKISGATHGTFVARNVSAAGFDHTWHFHPELELAWIESGAGRRFVGDSIESFQPGDLILVGSNLPHLFFTDPRDSQGPTWARASVVHFRTDVFGAAFLKLQDMQPVKELISRSLRGLQFSAKAASEVGPQLKSLVTAKGPSRIIGLLNALDRLSRSRAQVLSSRSFRPELRGADAERIQRVISWVHESYHDPIFLADAAKVAALAPAAFCRYFKKATGRTFSAFVNEIRIGRACRLLAETNDSVSQIAVECGFEALSNFNHRFQVVKRMSPREFRKKFYEAAGE